MRKIIFLLLALTLIASASGAKLVRLDIINDTGDTVYMKLEGTESDAFHYLTILDGENKSFTIETDLYKRTTWACGYETTGRLAATSNIRLKFTVCDQVPTKRVTKATHEFLCKYNSDTGIYQCPNYGEPTMEKVVYFKSAYGLPVLSGGCAGAVIVVNYSSPAKGLCYFRYRY